MIETQRMPTWTPSTAAKYIELSKAADWKLVEAPEKKSPTSYSVIIGNDEYQFGKRPCVICANYHIDLVQGPSNFAFTVQELREDRSSVEPGGYDFMLEDDKAVPAMKAFFEKIGSSLTAVIPQETLDALKMPSRDVA